LPLQLAQCPDFVAAERVNAGFAGLQEKMRRRSPTDDFFG